MRTLLVFLVLAWCVIVNGGKGTSSGIAEIYTLDLLKSPLSDILKGILPNDAPGKQNHGAETIKNTRFWKPNTILEGATDYKAIWSLSVTNALKTLDDNLDDNQLKNINELRDKYDALNKQIEAQPDKKERDKLKKKRTDVRKKINNAVDEPEMKQFYENISKASDALAQAITVRVQDPAYIANPDKSHTDMIKALKSAEVPLKDIKKYLKEKMTKICVQTN